MKHRHIVIFLCVILGFFAVSQVAIADSTVDLIPLSNPQTLYRAEAAGCGVNFIPDSPTRAFRRADGNIELIAAHFEDWMMLGKTFETLRPSCKSILDYDYYHSLVRGKLWIQGVYTEDGQHIQAIVSNDLGSATMAEGCNPAVHAGHCWVNQMISAKSDDMGNHFTPGPVIASVGDTYPPTELGQFGFFTSSNIVHQGQFYYVLMYITPPSTRQGQEGGTCLFRTSNINDPKSWRGWTGTEFSYQSSNPNAHCAVVSSSGVGPIRSIQFISARGIWIATTAGAHKLAGDSANVPGFYSMVSSDLIHWGPLSRITTGPLKDIAYDQYSIYSYPSLIDMDSKSRNFETIDHDTALLFFSVNHLTKYHAGTMNRDLLYVPVRIQ